ncbi:MAG TPA: ABC transporter substrate-binding protein [Burkholderiaceae bacterium]|nr:ABC transporter substrate-binding protein [Burkholderiaceae bacterium]
MNGGDRPSASAQRRRIVCLGVGGAGILAAPGLVRAQRALRLIGVLGLEPLNPQSPEWSAFVDELARQGFVVGRNLAFEHRYAADAQRMHQYASELVAMNVDAIYAVHGSSSALAAQKATSSIPIVFFASGDPVGNGLVASLARPGGNLTGNASLIFDVVSKSLQILSDAIGGFSSIAHIQPRSYRELPQFGALRDAVVAATRQLRAEVSFVDVDTLEQFDPALDQLRRRHVRAAMIGGGAPYLNVMDQIAALCIKYRLPTLINWPEFVRSGLLVSYSISQPDLARKSAIYVARILSGAKPADLPVQQPTRYELVINLKTARALGLTVPSSLLLRADEVIE